ncbi:hypothetical protein [Vibrio owensii]|uniref:hypothetical protein n=1 Tax=Vibrio owensii TaxID=696485 RepID=UPI00215BA81A|nr:hypothetical protein [Vibrio owensii]MCR9944551.1 hypothetical protein [Vibrio owensii]
MKKLSNEMTVFLSIVIVILSSFRITAPLAIYVISFALPILLIAFMAIYNRVISLRPILLASFISIAFIFNGFANSFPFGNSGYIHYEMYIFIFINIMAYGLHASLLREKLNTDYFDKLTKWLILSHASLFILQNLLWYILSYKLDFGLLLGGVEGRSSFYGAYRPTGVYAEPSIYSGYMSLFVSFRYVLAKRMDWVFYIGLLTIPLSLSTYAVLSFLILVMLFFGKVNIRSGLISIMLILGSGYYFYESLINRYELFLSGEDGSNNTKLYVISKWYNDDLYFTGFGVIKKVLYDGVMDGFGDISLYINLPMLFGVPIGIFASILFISMIVRKKISIRDKMILLFCFVKISGFASPAFWALTFLLSFSKVKFDKGYLTHKAKIVI